jgi:hypothetical protein
MTFPGCDAAWKQNCCTEIRFKTPPSPLSCVTLSEIEMQQGDWMVPCSPPPISDTSDPDGLHDSQSPITDLA